MEDQNLRKCDTCGDILTWSTCDGCARRDYEGMRDMQAKFIKADNERRELLLQLEAVKTAEGIAVEQHNLADAEARSLKLQIGEWEKLVRTTADQLYALGKQLRAEDAATGTTLQVISTELHRECQVIKGEDPLPHAGERLTEKPLSDLGLDIATYEAAKREQAEGKRIPIDDVIKGLPEKR
jgi:hypothetical protein